MRRRHLLQAAASFVPAMPFIARAAENGVTATEIRIGSTAAYSGPASAYGAIGRAHTATWNWFNEQGGVNGRKVKFLSYDDAYTPAKSIEQVRRLVEEDELLGIQSTLPADPLAARLDDVGAALLGGAERLFLYVSPSAAKA